MQRLFCTAWSMDAAYVFSGSDDTNVRVWRAKANERPSAPLPRERARREYQEALVEKFQYMPEVKRIRKHTHVPKAILKQAATKEAVQATQLKREKNRRAHSAPGAVPKVKAKKKKVWKVLE